MADYGFVHEGKVYTPHHTAGLTPAVNADRNAAIERDELERWQSQPADVLAYYDLGEHGTTRGRVSTWLGTTIGTILTSRIYRHNFGGRFVAIRVQGTNGAEYHGRASYDWAQCIMLRKCRTRASG
jgi:hypothetical protein